MAETFGVAKTAVIVEDDPDVRHLLAEVLEAAGFSVVSVGNGIDGVNAVLTYQPLITTLDVNMPGIDGFEAARRIRAGSDTYIIMLTALDEEADVVLGLGAGADEYLNKPFRPRELRARIDALLRRPRGQQAGVRRQETFGPSFPGARPQMLPPQPEYGVFHGERLPEYSEYAAPAYEQYPTAPAPPAPPPIPPQQAPQEPAATPVAVVVPSTAGPQDAVVPHEASDHAEWLRHRELRLDPHSRVVFVGDREVELTRTEFDLLAALMESKRRVRSKADLTLVLRGESYVTSYFVGEADKRAIEAHMTNLRRKLGDNPTQPRFIETVRGVGYRLTSEVSG